MKRPHHPIRQQVALECACCTQPYSPDRSFETRIDALIFGSEPYAVCPVCQQEVSGELQTERYKKRWRQEALPRLDDRAITVALLSIYLRKGLTGDERFHLALKAAQEAFPDKNINQLKSLGDEVLIVLDIIRRK